MCAIAGLINFNDVPVTRDEVTKILEKMIHRGRDFSRTNIGSKHANNNSGLFITDKAEIGLGHNRLAILDLNYSGSQPMFYAENQLCITYNGEIFNYLELKKILEKKSYIFKTRSDTEVLLAAYDYWGSACVHHLNGMYAFAIWDNRNKKLFCARDPLGIKPFYYRLTPTFFAFASESQALLHQENFQLHNPSVLCYFLTMYIAGEDSIFTGIKKLLPGYSLTLTPQGDCSLEKFWTIERFEEFSADQTHLSHLTHLLQQAVTKQLRCDVPVGGFLSGGIDSGLITALAAPQVKKYYTYSVGYEGLVNNELPHAKKIADRFDTEHTEVTVTADNAMNLLHKALKQLSEPVADPAIVATYLLSECAAADGVKVLLNGTGGDEIFAGYTRYTGQLSLKRKLMMKIPNFIKNSQLLPLGHKLKSRLRYPGLDMLYSTGGSYALSKNISNNPYYFKTYINEIGRKFKFSQNLPLLYQYMLFDMQVYLPDQLLFLLDQMTMAHTLEGRVPLLDLDVIKYAFQFKAKEHTQQTKTKAILKTIAASHLGHDYVNRTKQGFGGSSDWWVSQKRSEFIEGISEIRHIPYFEDFDIKRFIAENNANNLFLLYCFCQWYERIKSDLKVKLSWKY